MQLAEPTCAPPAERSLSPSLKSSAIQEGSQRGEQEPDQTTLEALSSDDTISSTHQQINATQPSDPILVFIYVPRSAWISTLMTESQMQQLKPHRRTLTTGNRAYICVHCRGLGHTKPKCPILLSGNQSIQPAKSIDPGRYIIYSHPDISDQRNNHYRLCDLRELPRELHPDSSPTQSRAEHSLFQSITENEMEQENTKRISLKFLSPGTTTSYIIMLVSKIQPYYSYLSIYYPFPLLPITQNMCPL